MPAAVSLLSRGVSLFGDDPEGSHLLPDLSIALREDGDFARAEAVIDKAIRHATRSEDLILEAHARIELAALRLLRNPQQGVAQATEEARQILPIFEKFNDDVGQAKAWEIIAEGGWHNCTYKEAEVALKTALVHATKAGDKRQLAAIRSFLVMSASLGPTHVEEALALCDQMLDESGDDRWTESACYRAMARLRAMKEEFGDAEALFEKGMTILQDLGLKFLIASSSQIAYTIFKLNDDYARAETYLKNGYQSFVQMGEKNYLSTTAGMLAQTLCSLGRYDEAEDFSRIAEENSAPEDAISQILWRGSRAKALAHRQELGEAEALARDAAWRAQQTDFLNAIGDALLDLSEVLSLCGKSDEATKATENALAVYEQKGNLAAARKARDLLGVTG